MLRLTQEMVREELEWIMPEVEEYRKVLDGQWVGDLCGAEPFKAFSRAGGRLAAGGNDDGDGRDRRRVIRPARRSPCAL